MAKERVRVWTFICWQESIKEGWIVELRKLHIPGAISPLHDQDKKEDGSFKKAHWHVVLNFSGVKSYEQVKEITDSIGAEFPVRVQEIGGLVRYLIHIDDPDKHLYERNDIIPLCGFDVDFYFDLPKSKASALKFEIDQYIEDNNIMEFCDLRLYCMYFNREWYQVISECYTNYFINVLKSRRGKYKDSINSKSIYNHTDQDGVYHGS